MTNEGTIDSNTKTSNYDSNPITNAITGMIIVLKNNPVTIILLPILYYLGLSMTAGSLALLVLIGAITKSPIIIAFLVLVSIAIFSLVAALFGGSIYATVAKSANNEKIDVGEAIRICFKKLLPYWGLNLLYGALIALGFLLFIIPGVIIAARGSLALLVFFEENLGAVDSLKRSFALTKGHVIEMLGTSITTAMLNGGGLGLLFGATTFGPYVGRYKDLAALKASGAEKPKIHWMNYLVVFGGIALLILYIVYIVVAVIAQAASTNGGTTSLLSQLKQIV